MLEFPGLRGEHSEQNPEEARLRSLKTFLLELRSNVAFLGRQRRLRVGDHWFRVDLLLLHRRLRCPVTIGLIPCTERNTAIAHYALDGPASTALAAEYRTTSPINDFLSRRCKRHDKP